MKLFKRTVLMAAALILSAQGWTQLDFQKTLIDKRGKDYKYSSMVRLEDDTGKLEGYVVASTRYNKAGATNVSDCVVTTLNPEGDVIKETRIDNYLNEVCLDVVIGHKGHAVITGYAIDNGMRQIMIVELEPTTGTIVSSSLIPIQDGQHGMGLTINYIERDDEYIVGGTSIKDPSKIDSGAEAVIMRLATDFSIVWSEKIWGPYTSGLTAVNETVITDQGNIFITGTFMTSLTMQGSLAVMLGPTGNIIWDLSQNSSNYLHMGVDAVYEPTGNGTLYLVSTNSRDHNCQITMIKEADTPGAYIATQYEIDVYSSFSGVDPVPMGIELSQSNPDRLVVMGQFTQAPYQGVPGHSPLYITEFNKFDGSQFTTWIYEVESPGFNATHDLLLSPFWTSQLDCMYSSSSFIWNDAGGYAFLGNRLHTNGVWYPEMFSTDQYKQIPNQCNVRVRPTVLVPQFHVPFQMTYGSYLTDKKDQQKVTRRVEIQPTRLCPGDPNAFFKAPEQGGSITTATNNQDMSIYPNPAQNGNITITLNNWANDKQIKLTNVSGQVLYQANTNRNTIQLDINDFSTGVYFVSISDQNKTMTKKLIIQ